MLDYLTFVSLRSHFAETNLISLSLSQFADFVCKLKSHFCGFFLYLLNILSKNAIISRGDKNDCERAL